MRRPPRNLYFISCALILALIGAFIAWRYHGHPSSPAVAERSSPKEAAEVISQNGGDPRSALAMALKQKAPALRSFHFQRLLQGWLAENPDAALAYLRGLPRDSPEYTLGLILLLGETAKNDPDRALELAAEMVATREQAVVYNEIFAQLTPLNPALAVAKLGHVTEKGGRANALRAIASTWAMRDPEAALQWARSLGETDGRPVAMEATLALFARNDPDRAIALAGQFLAGAARDRIFTDSIEQMTKNDPTAAGVFVATLADGAVKSQAVSGVARALAAESVDAALAWGASLPLDLRQTALNNTLDLWCQKDPDGAAQYVEQIPPGAEQNAAAGHLARDLAAIDPESAIEWAESLGGAPRAAAEVSISSTWARSDAPAAAQWTASLGTSGRPQAIQSALSFWVLKDGPAAADFARALPDLDQPAAIAAVVPVLAQNDPAATLQWAQSIPDDDNRALAIDAAVTRWADNSPAEAARWVATETSPGAQVDHARAVMEHWTPADPTAALSWARSLRDAEVRDGALDMGAAQVALTDLTLAQRIARSITAEDLREARLEAIKDLQKANF